MHALFFEGSHSTLERGQPALPHDAGQAATATWAAAPMASAFGPRPRLSRTLARATATTRRYRADAATATATAAAATAATRPACTHASLDDRPHRHRTLRGTARSGAPATTDCRPEARAARTHRLAAGTGRGAPARHCPPAPRSPGPRSHRCARDGVGRQWDAGWRRQAPSAGAGSAVRVAGGGGARAGTRCPELAAR